jgi:hypothetical protein
MPVRLALSGGGSFHARRGIRSGSKLIESLDMAQTPLESGSDPFMRIQSTGQDLDGQPSQPPAYATLESWALLSVGRQAMPGRSGDHHPERQCGLLQPDRWAGTIGLAVVCVREQ